MSYIERYTTDGFFSSTLWRNWRKGMIDLDQEDT